jgi:hypothetical protein
LEEDMKPSSRHPTTLVNERLPSRAPSIDPAAQTGSVSNLRDATWPSPSASIPPLRAAGRRYRRLALAARGLGIFTLSVVLGAIVFGRRQAAAPNPLDLLPAEGKLPANAPSLVIPPPRAMVEALPAREAAAAPVSNTILLSVRVWPPNARVSIDRQLVLSNPFVGRWPRDLETHHIRVSAPGFRSSERLVSFAADLILDLSLAPLSRNPSRQKVAPASGSQAALPALGSDRRPVPFDSNPPPRRWIESSNPYAGDDP